MGGPTYRVVAMFEDALNLADGAPVKLHGVTIGRVREVTPDNFTAKVSLELRESTPIHDGATARLRATTPLGELFVQIDDAESGPRAARRRARSASIRPAPPRPSRTR